MTDTSGYSGPLGVFDATTDFSELFFLIQQITNRNATAMLVQVKAVRGGGPTAPAVVDVQPLVHQIDGQGQITPHGIVPGLPCFRYAAGPLAVIIDPVVGDIGLAVFASHDISTVKNTKKPAAPGSRRRFDWADGLYFGAFLTGATTRYIRFTDSGIDVVSPNNGVNITGDVNISKNLNVDGNVAVGTGASGTFTSANGLTVTVQDGIITNIF